VRVGEDEEAINRMFTPEFRNRLDSVISFAALTPDTIGRVVDKFILQLEEQLADRNVTIELDADARKWLGEKATTSSSAPGPSRASSGAHQETAGGGAAVSASSPRAAWFTSRSRATKLAFTFEEARPASARAGVRGVATGSRFSTVQQPPSGGCLLFGRIMARGWNALYSPNITAWPVTSPPTSSYHASDGAAYERFLGRWTLRLAEPLLNFLASRWRSHRHRLRHRQPRGRDEAAMAGRRVVARNRQAYIEYAASTPTGRSSRSPREACPMPTAASAGRPRSWC